MSAHYNYYKVLLPIPKNGILTYRSEIFIPRGKRVKVSLRNRVEYGIVLDDDIPNENISYKDILEVLDDDFKINDNFIKLIFSIARYYCNDVGVVLNSLISKKIFFSDIEIKNEQKIINKKSFVLNEKQQEIFNGIVKKISKFDVHYIHGVTGSGKTEIYIKLIEKIISEGKQVLYLLPEIALTSQLTKRISERLGFNVDVYHSKLAFKKRQEIFWRFALGYSNILLGTRSALFIPADNIGLIIVDEEHENTLKQDESPYMHLRDMAVLYAKQLNIPIILGSATPSVESFYNCRIGKYNYYHLGERYNNSFMPLIEVVKLNKDEMIGKVLSLKLCDEIGERLKRGEQVILFLNKKGYAHNMICNDCGSHVMCPNCTVGLTFYQRQRKFVCHYCGESFDNYICPACGSDSLYEYSYGIEHVQKVVEELFNVSVLKLDTSEITSHTALEKKLKLFENKEYQILLGTQIIAKGFNFKDVTLVGIVDVDRLLSMPDFRSFERCYQLVHQVGGRAGRFDKPGKILIQTFNTENPFFNFLNDTNSFYNFELSKREAYGYPPYKKLCRILFEHSNKERCEITAFEVTNVIKNELDVQVLGPAKAPIFKIRNKFRYQCIIKSNTLKELHNACKIALEKFHSFKKGNILMKIDIDPYNFM
ncbi:primosomal protein N' [Deferribacter autotrophicus]|uniref:Replication restart protein PriA n=1 Tax=Deferribacter autotrophicus TaxID=500465 RepID=A0A5A8F2E3_9BACT|nr:primosomal protein N' [Deferribacter autotrophicus]KAA0257973.1 primosomal protein N' [Deferribacter autotrophicus]